MRKERRSGRRDQGGKGSKGGTAGEAEGETERGRGLDRRAESRRFFRSDKVL